MILEKALIALLNQEKDKADTLFHDFILERSRQIHESLRQGEDFILDESMEGIMSIDEMFSEDELAEDDLDPAADDGAAAVDAPEGEEAATDELTADDVEGDGEEAEGEEEQEEPIEDRVSDLEADIQRLAAEFDAMMGGDSDVLGDEVEGEEQVEEAMVQISTTSDGEINVMASTDDDEEGLDGGLAMDAAPMGDDMAAPADDMGMGDDSFDDLSESIVDELEKVAIPSGDGREQGNGKFKQNTVSPALNTPADKRLAGAPVKIKSDEHSGYDRENAPSTKKIATRSNVKATATAGQSAVKKEGDASAELNKLSADPAGQKSLLGSKK
jgi:hypothetical protein